jgi:hypothetical protein
MGTERCGCGMVRTKSCNVRRDPWAFASPFAPLLFTPVFPRCIGAPCRVVRAVAADMRAGRCAEKELVYGRCPPRVVRDLAYIPTCRASKGREGGRRRVPSIGSGDDVAMQHSSLLFCFLRFPCPPPIVAVTFLISYIPLSDCGPFSSFLFFLPLLYSTPLYSTLYHLSAPASLRL